MKNNNCYTGFHPPSPSWSPDRIHLDTITPSQFYTSYVSTRTPCIFTSHPTDPTWNATAAWSSLEELERRAGHRKVKIEQRSPQGGFGSGGDRLTLRLEEFLKRLKADRGDELYLTTQYKDENEQEEEGEEDVGKGRANDRVKGFEEYCQPPLSELTDDFAFRPALLGKLVPQQVNLWLGSVRSTTAEEGTSSGLHHDFHDNLYILLRGRKRFTLFSPRDSGRMYTFGNISTVHPNGLINYQEHDRGTNTSRADGAYPRDVVRWRLHAAEQRFAELESKGEDTTVAESELEKITEEMLDFEVEEDHNEEEEEFGFDDYDDDDEDVFTESEEEGEETRSKKKKKANNKRRVKRRRSEIRDRKKKSNKRTKKVSEESLLSHPPSFSKIPVSVLHRPSSGSKGPFPLLSKATKVTCHLGPGEMLYLPASWFHEVTSYADSSASDSIHMAFNYWMAPPTTKDESQPYEDGYWEHQWKGIEEESKRRKGKNDKGSTLP